MVTMGGVTSLYIAVGGVTCPSGAAGAVGPKPVPMSTMVSPGLAGTVATLGNAPAFSAMLESRWVAATYDGSHWKNAGETADIGTASGGIAVAPPTIRISPGPGMISTGTRALIWVGL